jgi:hypothetical protein
MCNKVVAMLIVADGCFWHSRATGATAAYNDGNYRVNFNMT